jgi:hypothetical protein
MRSDSSAWSRGFQHRILVHALGMKLLIHPFLQSDALDAFDVAGRGPKVSRSSACRI